MEVIIVVGGSAVRRGEDGVRGGVAADLFGYAGL